MTSPLAIAPAGNGGYLLPAGYLSTQGSQIVDAAGTPVRMASIGWNQGFGTTAASVAAMKAAGFNTIRVSWANATLAADLQRIDQVVAAAKANGLKVVLDNHTNEPGHGPQDNYGAQQKNGLWYDVGGASDGTDGGGNKGTTTDAQFLKDWVTVAQHYAGNDTVAGFDLRNEPLEVPGGSTWGDGNVNTDIRLMYQRVGNAIQKVNPGPLIIAEGPQNYSNNAAGTGPAPWGDVSLAGSKPVTLGVANKVVYSVHDYPQEISGWAQDSGAAKIAAMNADWGYLITKNIAPVWIGEMGSSMQASTDAAWARTLTDYMNGKNAAQGGPAITGNQQPVSGDWWAWGNLAGQFPNGTLNADGSLKADQKAVWSQLLYKPATAVAQPPPPAAPKPASPDNTILTGATGTIADARGNSWTITAAGQVAVNGTADATTSNVIELAYEKGQIWQENASKLWWSKSAPADQWGPAAGTSTSPIPGAAQPASPGAAQPASPGTAQPASPGSTTLGTTAQPATPGTWIIQTVNGMQYMVLLPAGYDPTVKYATTLYLHQLDNGSFGPTALQNQINAWFNGTAFRSAHPSIVVAPLLDQTTDLSMNTFNFGGMTIADNIGESNAIAALKQVMAQYSADPNRIYVTGNSMGGIGTWDMLVKYNAYTGTQGKIFAAGMPLAGADYAQGLNPSAAIVQALKNVPIWAIHGGKDTTVSLQWDQKLFAAEQAAGGVMKYTQDAGLGHDVWDTYYTQAAPFNWLYSQKLPGSPPPPPVVASTDNTVVQAGSAAVITDAAGNKWGISKTGQVTVNGTADTTTSGVAVLAYEKGLFWQENSAKLWWSKTLPSDTWGPAAGTATSPVPVKPVVSADNTVLRAGSAAAITDGAGNKWTINAAGQVAINGAADATTAGVTTLAFEKGLIWQQNGAKLWWSKTLPTDAWGPIAGTATSPVPMVKPAVSADNTVITGAAAVIVDAASNTWTITATGQVAVNGVADATTSGVVALAYEKGLVWQENSANLWWSKTLPTDAWGPVAGTATSPVKAAIAVLTNAGASQTISAAVAATTQSGGDTFTIAAPGIGSVVLGTANESLRFTAMTKLAVSGGSGSVSLTADGGTNNFLLGKGTMDVTGGRGADAYVLHNATGALTIEDFSTAKGDTLTIDATLQGAMKMAADGRGGTMLSFTGATETVSLKGVASLQSSVVHWA